MKGVDKLLDAAGGRPSMTYKYDAESIAYFAPEPSDFAETGELKGEDLAAAERITDERGLSGGTPG